VVAYKSATNQLTESDFYLDSKGQMRFTGNGAPVVFEVNHDDEGWAENAKIVEFDAEMQARADILNRAVEHKQRLFPDEIGNGWIDSIDRLADEIKELRTINKILIDKMQQFAGQGYDPAMKQSDGYKTYGGIIDAVVKEVQRNARECLAEISQR
jgi:hypothetical protein